MATRRFPPVKYITPDLEGNRLAYRGRRYWLVELADGASFQCVDKEEADYVVFDRLDDAPIARVTRIPDGTFEISTIMGFASDYSVTLEEAVKVAASLIDEELKACI